MDVKEAYKQKMDAQLKEWSTQISLLEAKAENTSADLKVKYATELSEPKSKQQIAAKKFEALGETSGEAWEKVKESADHIWDDLKASLARAQARFK